MWITPVKNLHTLSEMLKIMFSVGDVSWITNGIPTFAKRKEDKYIIRITFRLKYYRCTDCLMHDYTSCLRYKIRITFLDLTYFESFDFAV